MAYKDILRFSLLQQESGRVVRGLNVKCKSEKSGLFKLQKHISDMVALGTGL